MAIHKKQFDSYRIYYMTGGNEVPVLDCYDGSSFVGKLIFHRDSASLPSNIVRSDGVVHLRYSLSQFNDVIDMLRYEKPLYLRLSTPSLVGFLAPEEAEPVGEEESYEEESQGGGTGRAASGKAVAPRPTHAASGKAVAPRPTHAASGKAAAPRPRPRPRRT